MVTKLVFLFLFSETCVFAYLGMAIFSFKHQFRPAFVIWTIVSTVPGANQIHDLAKGASPN